MVVMAGKVQCSDLHVDLSCGFAAVEECTLGIVSAGSTKYVQWARQRLLSALHALTSP